MKVVFECEEFLAADKPAGILSQKDKSGDPDLAQLLREERAREGRPLAFLAPAHRLDRNTSGLLLLAKSPAGARRLDEWIREGELHRTYLGIVKGDPGAEGRYDFPLQKNERTNEVRVHPDGAPASTVFTRLQKLPNSSLVRVQLLTGRSHQIRVHFAHAGHALIGDKKYAKKPWSEIFGRPALHAYELELPRPHARKLTAELPEDFLGLLAKLGGKI